MKKALIFFFIANILYFSNIVWGRKLLYKEEFYRIYYLPQTYANDDLTRTIYWLQWAVAAPFAPPIQALKPHEKEEDYQKYQALLKMHIHYLLTKNTAYLAARFDKHKPVFFNKPYKKDILRSLDIAEYLYDQADIYWEKTLKQWEKVRKMKGESNLSFLEQFVEKVRLKEIDWTSTLKRKKENLKKTRAYFSQENP